MSQTTLELLDERLKAIEAKAAQAVTEAKPEEIHSIDDLAKKVVEQMQSDGNFDGFMEKIQESKAKFNEPRLMSALKPTRADLPYLVAGIGAGSAAGLVSYVTPYLNNYADASGRLLGMSVVTVAELLVGYLIWKLGGAYNKWLGALGAGIFIEGVAMATIDFGLYLKPKGTTGGTASGMGGLTPEAAALYAQFPQLGGQ